MSAWGTTFRLQTSVQLTVKSSCILLLRNGNNFLVHLNKFYFLCITLNLEPLRLVLCACLSSTHKLLILIEHYLPPIRNDSVLYCKLFIELRRLNNIPLRIRSLFLFIPCRNIDRNVLFYICINTRPNQFIIYICNCVI